MNTFKTLLEDITCVFSRHSIPFCLVGGFAVTFRAEPRLTRDIDLVVVTDSDAEREELVLLLTNNGFVMETLLQSTARQTIGTARLLASQSKLRVYVDLLFDATGIEKEVVERASTEVVFDDLPTIPIATIPSLIAMKCLSYSPENRSKDYDDLKGLVQSATPNDLDEAKELMKLIQDRGYARGENLQEKFQRLSLTLAKIT